MDQTPFVLSDRSQAFARGQPLANDFRNLVRIDAGEAHRLIPPAGDQERPRGDRYTAEAIAHIMLVDGQPSARCSTSPLACAYGRQTVRAAKRGRDADQG